MVAVVAAAVDVVDVAVVGSILRSNNSMLTHNMLSITPKFVSAVGSNSLWVAG